MKRNNIPYFVWALSLATTLFLSCSREDVSDSASGKQVALSVSLTSISESDETTEITRSGSQTAPAAQTVTVPAGNGMSLEATLERNTPVVTRGTTALPAGVKYRVIAFKENDVSSSGYISYADYEVGTAGAIAGDLHAPLGSSVTFVCYSLGTTSLPVFNQNSLDVAADPATDDLLYAKFNQTITTGSTTVSFTLKHQFSLVTVIADASVMSQDISAISCSLSPNYSGTLSLSTGALTAGTSAARSIPWGTITTGQIVTAIPCTVFTNTSSAITVSIPSVTIGGTTKTNLTAPFGTNAMQQGYKYTLRLKFIKGYGIVLAGLTWAEGNLIYTGGTYSFAATQEYCSSTWNGGDYWGWCQLNPTVITSYSGDYNTSVDPCRQVAPAGTWRMPTSAEFTSLINATSVGTTRNGVYGRYFGTNNATTAAASPNNYVFLPAAGRRDNGSTAMVAVGSHGYYWSATPNGSNAYTLDFNSSGADAYGVGRDLGFAIRCVK